MNLSAFTLIVEAVFVVLLLVTIVYAVKLNARISGLRARESELQEMFKQFNEASDQALDSVQILKSAGVEADRQINASTERAQALREDLAYMIEHGERIADRLERAATTQGSARNTVTRPAGEAEPNVPTSQPADDDGQYRSEIEQALAQVIRSTAMAG